MSWNGELTSGNARPIGGNILIKIREEKGQTTSGLFLGLEAADKASVVGEVIRGRPGPRAARRLARAAPCAVGDTVRFQDLDVTECDIEDEERLRGQPARDDEAGGGREVVLALRTVMELVAGS